MDSLNPNIPPQSFKYQQVVGQCRDIALIKLSALLSEMYNHTEPVLLEFSDKAESNAIRRIFTEAAQKTRDMRPIVEQAFQKEISKGYANFLHKRASVQNENQAENPQQAQWSLVDKADFEDNIAIQKIAYKANNLFYKEIHAYTQRMTLIHGGNKLADQDLPASPVHIMNAFKTAILKVEIESRTKLIMYALCEKYIMKNIGSIFDECNKHLIDAGIFPNLKPIANKKWDQNKKQPHTPENPEESLASNKGHLHAQPTTNKKEANTESEYEALSSELFNTINSLLVSQRKHSPEYSTPAAAPDAAPIEMANKDDLVKQIANIQPTISKTTTAANAAPQPTTSESQPATIPILQVDQVFLDGLRNTLTEERNRLFEGVERRRILTADMNTIELVGMLFDQVLDDPVLPNAVKAAICHLHTPYLKAAILDATTLASENHPAQQLLNLMVRVGSQWVDEINLDIGIYPHLREIIDNILANFEEDMQIFEDSYKALQNHAAKLEQKSAAIEKRSQEAARGRDKFENARVLAMQTIKDRTASHQQLPDTARQFFKHAWTDKLILIILRDPNFKDSEVWRESLQIMDEIVALLRTDTVKKESVAFHNQLGLLRKTIEQSLSTLGNYHQVDVDMLFKLLCGTLTEAEKKHAAEASTDRPESTKETLGIDSQILSFTDDELDMLQKLENVKCGTWFEYLIKGRKGKRRIKLSWYSPVTKKYMFVDHNGIQAMVISDHALVQDLCKKNARILGRIQIPFISQAFSSIKERLQQSNDTQPTPG